MAKFDIGTMYTTNKVIIQNEKCLYSYFNDEIIFQPKHRFP